MASTATQVAHIWRRLGFGPTKADLDAGDAMGPAALVDWMLARPATAFAAAGYPAPVNGNHDPIGLRQLELMAFGPVAAGVATTSPSYHPLQERIAWLLQGLVVVSITDSVYLEDMHDHLRVLRDGWSGSYRQLLATVSTRPGMLKYLSGFLNTKDHPNQNYARELLELFSLGRVHPLTGAANYSQADIVEVARALSGWRYHWDDGSTSFSASEWDAGSKTFLGAPRGAAGLAEVLDAIVAHPSWTVHVPARLYRDLTGLAPTADVLAALGAAWGSTGDLAALVSAIVHRPEFLSDAAISSKTRSPIELLVAAMRVLGWNGLRANETALAAYGWYLRELGQHPLSAPNVSGWPRGDQWLNATNLQRWCAVINELCTIGLDWSGAVTGTVLPGVTLLHQNASGATAAALACRMTGITEPTSSTTAALTDYATAGSWTPGRAAGVLSLVFVAPEFLVG